LLNGLSFDLDCEKNLLFMAALDFVVLYVAYSKTSLVEKIRPLRGFFIYCIKIKTNYNLF